MVKNLPTNAGDLKDVGSIPDLERFPGGGGMATHSSILAWRILLTEEPGGLLCMGSQRVRQLSTSIRQSSSAMKWISSDILDS